MSWKKPAANREPKVFSINNRKYIGSKRELAPRIFKIICKASGLPEVFFDAFLGTGSIASYFIARGIKKIITCDNLFSNTVIFKGFFEPEKKECVTFVNLINELNGLNSRSGYITENFSDIYFTRENCRRMDSIREEIEGWKQKGMIGDQIHSSLLASFLLAVDRVANTLGQYDAFLKNIGSDSFKNGHHVIDQRVYERFELRELKYLPGVDREIHTDDVFTILGEIEADTAYLDPPYNSRQYCDNYHLLENLARWEKPAVKGITKKFDRKALKSPFSQKRKAKEALSRLLDYLRARHIYLSYNSEGILSIEDIQSIIEPFGLKNRWDIPYPVFGKGAGVSKKRLITEYLFHFSK
jgi:adenine-specific DNA-methyltransferase